MWIVFGVLLAVWVVSIQFYFPAWITIALMGAMVAVVALALMPSPKRAPSYIWKVREF